MATIEQLQQALVAADKAGNADDARKLAAAIKAMRAQPQGGRQSLEMAAGQLSEMSRSMGGQPASKHDVNTKVRARLEATKLENAGFNKGAFNAASQGANAGFLAGFDDEISAGIAAPFRSIRDKVGLSEAYTREQALEKELKRRRQEAHPVANIVGEMGGGMTLGGGMSKAGLTMAGKNLPVIGRTGATMAEGAGYGAAYGAGNADEGERAKGAMEGAAVGALTAGALEKGGNLVAKGVARFKQGAAPTLEKLRSMTSQAYDEADNLGTTLRRGAMNRQSQGLQMKMQQFGYDKDYHPMTKKAISKFDELWSGNGPITAKKLEGLRQNISADIRASVGPSGEFTKDAAGAWSVVKHIDDLMDDVKNFNFGDLRATSAYKSARDLSSRVHRADVLDRVRKAASNSEGAFDDALVRELRHIANNKGLLNQFTKPEQELIKSLVRRVSPRSILRGIGKLSPVSTTGGIAAGGASIAGSLSGAGILPGIGVAAGGFGARQGANLATRTGFHTLSDAARRGMVLGPQQLGNPMRAMTPALVPPIDDRIRGQ